METIVGVTGCQDLKRYRMEALERSIRDELLALGQGRDRRVILSSLAKGADQLCARIGLSLGYSLVCPLPFRDYRSTFRLEDLETYDALLGRARETIIVSTRADPDETYLEAGKYVADHCDVLLAVWDGIRQASACGTEAVVAYAGTIRKPVRIIAPMQ